MSDTSAATTANGGATAGKSSTAASAAQAREALESLATEASGRVREQAEQVRGMAVERAGYLREQVDEFVTTRPWDAVIYAALGGLVLGLWLKR